MEDIDSSPTSPSQNPLKRAAPHDETITYKPLNLKGSQFVHPTPPDTEESSNGTSPDDAVRAGSPAPSVSTLTSIDTTTVGDVATSTPTATSGPPAKKRKLTLSEKPEREREKAAKEVAKAELKVKKEEERRVKDDEKRVKDEEKRRKGEEKEAKKREKELEEQRKVDQKMKKESSQMRLGAFFQKPATPAKADDGGMGASGSTRRKSLSLEPFEAVADQIRRSASPAKRVQKTTGTPKGTLTPSAVPQEAKAESEVVDSAPAKPAVSAYRKTFLPFAVQTHTTMAPLYSIPNPDDLAYWQGTFDAEIAEPSFREMVDLGLVEPTALIAPLFTKTKGSSRGLPTPHLKSLIDRIQGTSKQPIDLTRDTPIEEDEAPAHALHAITRKYLHFDEDVRPAYFGTYTKLRSPRACRRLACHPFARVRTDTDYDYDSEAEWEEPEEGEDILDDNEDVEKESVGDAEDMAFLDDEGDALRARRALVTTDLQAISTGLCWEDSSGRISCSVKSEDDGLTSTPEAMRDMRLGFLIPSFTGQSIDPFSTSYWAHEMAPPHLALPVLGGSIFTRPPLQERTNSSNAIVTSSTPVLLGAAEGEKGPITSAAAAASTQVGAGALSEAKKRGPKLLREEDLSEFSEAVVGSPLGKLELLKGLKLR